MRKYKSGTRWCLWRWTDFRPSSVGQAHSTQYIDRLHLLQTPWFAVCIHFIRHPDPEPWLHDHPVTFLSVILTGGYKEMRGFGHGGFFYQRNRWFNFVQATDRHAIIEVEPHTVTIAFMGPKTREWGFHTDKGWVYWKDYYAQKLA